jgi:3'-phosphoadenosine 5'-phosphosulfate sulfotransferase (PAPS reductase)/FAD synthetase
MLSGGAGSWEVARRVVAEHGIDQTTLLFADTLVEDLDLYRFLDDVSKCFNLSITRVSDGRTPWQVFHDKRHIGNTRIAPCSELLKQVPCRKWMEDNDPEVEAIIYVGIDWTETHRLPAMHHAWDPWRVVAPLCNPPYLSKAEMCSSMESAGIAVPRLYAQGFPHNNCGGACVRAGQAQWRLLLNTNPERYAQEEAHEAALREHLGKDVAILRDRRGGTTKALPLSVLRCRATAEIDNTDWGGCGCFVNSVSQE